MQEDGWRLEQGQEEVGQDMEEEEGFVVVKKHTAAKLERSMSADLSQELMEKATVEEEDDDPVSTDPHLQFPFLTDARSLRWVETHPVIFLMRGLSGSGKSTVAEAIAQAFPDAKVCSADHFFLDEDGKYVFDADKLKEAHAGCQAAAAEACAAGASPLVVDNTNVKKWEMNYYFTAAARHGYTVVLVESKTPWRLDAK